MIDIASTLQQRLSRAWVHALAFVIVASPRISEACAVCSSGKEDENRLAFILTTAFLTVLPLSIIAALVWWLKGRFSEQERLHECARQSSPAVTGRPSPGAVARN